jgi:hypothetical protein
VAVTGGAGTALVLIGDRGVVDARPVESDEARVMLEIPDRTPYVRAQLVDSGGEIGALTSPIWLT